MDTSFENPSAPMPTATVPAARGKLSGLVRLLYSSNPFYVISADLVFLGLRLSFNPGTKSFDTLALMVGLAAYTLLLAATAVVLIRYGKVWQDVRTILLLVVLMFLATSVTIDDTLIWRPNLGRAYFLGALVFSVVVSEAVLRGIQLRLPAGYRVPYYLLLALFFVYPVAISPWMNAPASRAMHWGLFLFPTIAGAIFLTLIPAVRRGREYIAGNGSPWRWPLYPWVLFGFLALGVIGRSYYLCISLHNVHEFQSIFGPYFLVPFFLAICVLMLETALARQNRAQQQNAIAAPFTLCLLAVVGHRQDEVYQNFLQMMRIDLGGTPLFLTVLLLVGFFVYAWVRRVAEAPACLTAALGLLTVIGPTTTGIHDVVSPQPAPLLAIGILHLVQWLRHREQSWRALFALGCLAAAPVFAIQPAWPLEGDAGKILAFHLGLLVIGAVGVLCDDALARFLRTAAAVMLVVGGAIASVAPPHPNALISSSMIAGYPLILAIVALGYAAYLRHRPSFLAACACLAIWSLATVGHGYAALRRALAGLDHIALGLFFFLLAALISLRKAGLLQLWFSRRRPTKPAPVADEWLGP